MRPRFIRGSKPLSKAVAEGVAPKPQRPGVPLTTNRVGAMWTWFFTPGPVTNYDEAAKVRHGGVRPLPSGHAGTGRLVAASQFEAAFLGTAHGDAEVAATIAGAKEAFKIVASR